MPKALAQGKTIECDGKANLGRILQHNGIDLYNGGAKVINCRDSGSCGTGAVKVKDGVSAANWRDKGRLFASSPFSYNKAALSLSN